MDLSLKELCLQSVKLLKKAENLALRYGDDALIIGFSGGKDSQCILELAKMAGVSFRAIYRVTTIDPPQNVNFIKEFYPEVERQLPKRNFWQLCEAHNMLPNRWCRFCCGELKENAVPLTVTITGVRREESVRRSQRGEVVLYSRKRHPFFVQGTFNEFEQEKAKQSEIQCMQGKDHIVINPILTWSEQHVWQFIKDRNLPVNPLYQTQARVGCICCPIAGKRSIIRDAKAYPKYFAAWLRLITRIWHNKRAMGDLRWEWAKDNYEIFLHSVMGFDVEQIQAERANLFGWNYYKTLRDIEF